MPYGAFVEYLPGKEGLLHISEISWQRVEDMEKTGLKENDPIEVKLLEIDKKTGKVKLSHKVLTEKPAKEQCHLYNKETPLDLIEWRFLSKNNIT